MKRIHPSPQGLVAYSPDLKRPCLQLESNLNNLPFGLIVKIFNQFREQRDLLSAASTCQHLLKAFKSDDFGVVLSQQQIEDIENMENADFQLAQDLQIAEGLQFLLDMGLEEGQVDRPPQEGPNRFAIVPLSVIHDVIFVQFLNSKDVIHACATHKRFYEDFTDVLWQDMGSRDFPENPLIAPGQGFKEEYKRQSLLAYNFARGIFASRLYPIEQNRSGITAFVMVNDGRAIMGYQDGSVKIFNPETKNWVTLSPPSTAAVNKLLCYGPLCVAEDTTGTLTAWNLKTGEQVAIPQGTDTGFSKTEKGDSKLVLTAWTLLRCSNNNIVEVWRVEDTVVHQVKFEWPIACMTLSPCGNMLCCIMKNHKAVVHDFRTGNRKKCGSHFSNDSDFSVNEDNLLPERICAVKGAACGKCSTHDIKIYLSKFGTDSKGHPLQQCCVLTNHCRVFKKKTELFASPAKIYSSVPNDPRNLPETPKDAVVAPAYELSAQIPAFADKPFFRQIYLGVADPIKISFFQKHAILPSSCQSAHGGLYFLCSDPSQLRNLPKTDIENGTPERHFLFCADFTVTCGEALSEINAMLSSRDPSMIYHAIFRFSLLPNALKTAIQVNFQTKASYVNVGYPFSSSLKDQALLQAAISEYVTPGSGIPEADLLKSMSNLIASSITYHEEAAVKAAERQVAAQEARVAQAKKTRHGYSNEQETLLRQVAGLLGTGFGPQTTADPNVAAGNITALLGGSDQVKQVKIEEDLLQGDLAVLRKAQEKAMHAQARRTNDRLVASDLYDICISPSTKAVLGEIHKEVAARPEFQEDCAPEIKIPAEELQQEIEIAVIAEYLKRLG
jgi:hypothetical protein